MPINFLSIIFLAMCTSQSYVALKNSKLEFIPPSGFTVSSEDDYQVVLESKEFEPVLTVIAFSESMTFAEGYEENDSRHIDGLVKSINPNISLRNNHLLLSAVQYAPCDPVSFMFFIKVWDGERAVGILFSPISQESQLDFFEDMLVKSLSTLRMKQ